MNKKTLGSSIRRGVLTGTVAGFVAGWSAFVGHAKQIDAAQQDAWQDVEQKKADVVLPAIPALPDLGDEPGAASYRIGYGPSGAIPHVTVGSAPAQSAPNGGPAAPVPQAPGGAPVAAPPPPPPAFAPLPALPPAPAAPAPVTQPTPPRK